MTRVTIKIIPSGQEDRQAPLESTAKLYITATNSWQKDADRLGPATKDERPSVADKSLESSVETGSSSATKNVSNPADAGTRNEASMDHDSHPNSEIHPPRNKEQSTSTGQGRPRSSSSIEPANEPEDWKVFLNASGIDVDVLALFQPLRGRQQFRIIDEARTLMSRTRTRQEEDDLIREARDLTRLLRGEADKPRVSERKNTKHLEDLEKQHAKAKQKADSTEKKLDKLIRRNKKEVLELSH